ncbi:MAG: L-2-amino-thiazoline-4-carboxylic acid hydrolase [Proteobacteria bacterium]|nr:L-2-amino-thiazoline-4-carboxylic acid hydrolase [Pseudomonadota bacterium]
MCEDVSQVPILVRREIEALIAAPLIQAYADVLGEERALAIAEGVVKDLARGQGRDLARLAGGDSLEHLIQGMAAFSSGGAHEIEPLEGGPNRMDWNTTRCRYAEMYQRHGLERYGYLLSCGRDFALFEGFNPAMKLARTQTIMEGHDLCDFRLELKTE